MKKRATAFLIAFCIFLCCFTPPSTALDATINATYNFDSNHTTAYGVHAISSTDIRILGFSGDANPRIYKYTPNYDSYIDPTSNLNGVDGLTLIGDYLYYTARRNCANDNYNSMRKIKTDGTNWSCVEDLQHKYIAGMDYYGGTTYAVEGSYIYYLASGNWAQHIDLGSLIGDHGYHGLAIIGLGDFLINDHINDQIHYVVSDGTYLRSWDFSTCSEGKISWDGTYCWMACGDNDKLYELSLNLPPTTPTLIAPADGNESTDTTPFFNWTTSTDADGDSLTYTLQVDNETTFTSPYVYENTTLTNSNLTLADADALDDGVFYWRVCANDSYGDGDWATYFNFTIDATPPVISNMNVTPSTVLEDEDVTISCDAVDALVGMGSVWVTVIDSKARTANHTLTSGSAYSLLYGFTGKSGTFNVTYFHANDTLGNAVSEVANLEFVVQDTGGGPGPGPQPTPTPSVTPFPESCDDRCLACGYLSGLCRWDGCRCAEVAIGQADCQENETCCCLKSLEPCPTLTPTPPEWDWLKPFRLLYEYLQRVFFYTPFMPDEINQTKQFPWSKIANKNLTSCMASMGECYVQPGDNYSIFINYTESREEMWARKEFINITVWDVDDYPAWAKMDILIINLAAYFDVPPERWEVDDDAAWHYLFKYERDINEVTWVTGCRLWWLVLAVLAVVIGVFGNERKKKRRGDKKG